ncbi:MAG: energy transducer TonB [Acidobacteriota bacterium]
MGALADQSIQAYRHPDNFRLMCIISLVAHIGLMIAATTLPGVLIKPSEQPIMVNLVTLPGPPGRGTRAGSPPQARPAPQEEPAPSQPKLTYPEKPQAKKPPPAKKAPATTQAAAKPKETIASKLESRFEGNEFSTFAGAGTEGAGGSGLSGFPFAFYLQRVRDKISSNWFQSIVVGQVTGEYAVTVFFQIQRDGRVTNVQVEESSGIPSLDMSAQRAVYASTPLPALPQGYPSDTLNVHFVFHYER